MVRTAGLEPTLPFQGSRFSCHFGFRRRPRLTRTFVVWTIPSPWPPCIGFRRRPSSLYTFPLRGLARDWLGSKPVAFPEFGRFCTAGFPAGTPVKVCCVYQFRHVRKKCWRLGSESNRRTRLCRPLHDHSAT